MPYGGVSDWFWPTHHTSHALCWPHHASCWLHHASCWCTMHRVGRTTDRVGCTAHFVGHTMHCVGHTECDKKHLVNIKFKIFLSVLAFSGWKNKFFQNCSKLPKNHFRTIKISFFFPDFPQLQEWVGGSDQIWKIPDFFLFSFFNPSLNPLFFFLNPSLRVPSENVGKLNLNVAMWYCIWRNRCEKMVFYKE